MKKRRLLPVLLVLLLLLLAAVAALLFAGGGQDSDSSVAESVKPSSLLLQASQDRFRVYKGAQTELTVTSCELDEGTVTITDDLGKTVLSLELKDGTATGTIGVFEESPRCIQLTASMGEATSQPLNLYVAPEVTAEMIQNGFQVAQELGQALVDQGFTTVDEAAVASAKTWLENDDRVEAIVPMDNGLFYYTTDGIAGACTLSAKPGTFGSTLFTQEENETLITYADWAASGLSEYRYLWSDNTLTNDKILVLRPRYQGDLTGDAAKERKKKDACVHYESPAEVANTLASGLNVATPEICDDHYAVEKLTSGTINEYGIILLNTHGYTIGPEGIPTEEKLFVMLLERGNAFQVMEDRYNEYEEYLQKELHIDSDSYSYFFTKYYEDAVDNIGTCLYYMDVADGVQSALQEIEEMEARGEEGPLVRSVAICGTANLITSLYQNKTFDNSIVYFGVCYSMENTKLAQFLIDHGAVACVGYTSEADFLVEEAVCKAFFGGLLTQSKQENRLMNVEESCEAFNGGVAGSRSVMIFAREFNNWLSWLPIIEKKDTNQTNTHTIADPADYTLKGTGTLSGTVQMDQTGEPVGGALVELYRWLDQEFVLMGTTSTTGKGTFEVEDIPWGVYVAKVTTEEGAPAYANCILAAEKWDAGTILAEGMSPYYVYIRDELEPKLGLFELGEKSQEIYDFNAQGWDMRTGILSAAIQDMNADGTDDMVLLRVELEDRKGWNLQTLYADMYTMEKGKVVLKDSVKLDVFDNCEIHDTWAAMYETENGYDLFVQSYSESVLFSGNDPIYSRYRFDGDALRKVFSIEQTEGGTTEKVYSEMTYDAETGQETATALWRDEMLWGWDGPGLYNSWGYQDSLSMYWAYLEEKMAMKAPGDVYEYPSYVGADQFTSAAEFKNDGVPVGGMGGDFSMSVMDYTDLRGALEELEKQ